MKHPYAILSMFKLSSGFDLNTHIIFNSLGPVDAFKRPKIFVVFSKKKKKKKLARPESRPT